MKTKPKKATVGVRIANTVYREGTMTDALLAAKLARRIDREVRAAAWKAEKAAGRLGFECGLEHACFVIEQKMESVGPFAMPYGSLKSVLDMLDPEQEYRTTPAP
jgi:hypothetical protein